MTDAHTPRSHLFFKEVKLRKRGPLLSLELRPRLSALVVEFEEDGDEFVRCASGMSLPFRGRVLLGTRSPARSPELRATIGSLLMQEPPLTGGGTVRSYLKHVLSVRHTKAATEPPLPETIPLTAPLLDEPAEGLSRRKRRLLALGLALSLDQPQILTLHNPLLDLDEESTNVVLSALKSRATSGCIVVCAVPNERTAARLTDKIHHLGHASRRVTPHHFLIRSERPREVASVLTQSEAIISSQLTSSGELVVGASSPEAGASAITAALCACQVEVYEVRLHVDRATLKGSSEGEAWLS